MTIFGRAKNRISSTTWEWRCKLIPDTEGNPRSVEEIVDDEIHADACTDDEDEKPIEDLSIKVKGGRKGKGIAKGGAKTKGQPPVGLNAKVKHYYEGNDSVPGGTCAFYDWQSFPPKAMSQVVIKNLSAFAINVYKIKDRSKVAIGNRFPLKVHKIEVCNPQLVAALAPILKKENVHLNLKSLATFEAPFCALYFGMPDILELHNSRPADDPMKPFLALLVKVLDDAFGELRHRAKSMRAARLMNYDTAWTYFPRGTIVYSYGKNSEILCRVESTRYTMKGFTLDVKILTFDGEGFVWRDGELIIESFEGNKPITELAHYPLKYHQDPETLKAKLTERGKRVLDMQGLRYCTYEGTAILETDKGPEHHNVEGRILVDVQGYSKYHRAVGKRETDDPETARNAATTRPADRKAGLLAQKNETDDGFGVSGGVRATAENNNNGKQEGEDNEDEVKKSKGKLVRLSEEDQRANKEEMLGKPDLLKFINPLIEGFSLKSKLWMNFYVEDIMPMEWNDSAFDHLVYDEQQKDLVMSFVEHHGKKQATFDDVIVGKGQGLTMLLSGPPGTGKTLTAEAVADKSHRPLLYLQAEDLGISAASLGANIKRFFSMAIDWQAVILLDEADVFMAERTPSDIARNELVSIFLRELEYFRGVIFLTTNLYHTIDTAFRSRVSLHLLFKPLSKDARELVWRKFLDRVDPAAFKVAAKADDDDAEGEVEQVHRGVSDQEIVELGMWKLNGREIKNAVKMCQLWCDFKGYAMTLDKLESAIKATSPHVSKEGEHDHSLYD